MTNIDFHVCSLVNPLKTKSVTVATDGLKFSLSKG